MKIKEIIKYEKIMQDNKIKCRCGHSLVIPPNIEKVICHWCGNYVFKGKKKEFEFRLKEAQNKK